MYVVMGITGQVGGAVARNLLDAGRQVRAVVRDANKGMVWKERGCEIAMADLSDIAATTEALRGVEAAFLVIPPLFDPAPGFPEVGGLIAGLRTAILEARPGRLVCLSTIGAQATQPSLLSQLGLVEDALGDLPLPVAFLRAAWFMENFAGDVGAARAGTISSFLQPLEKPFPMVATVDIGRLGASMLQEHWTSSRIVELEGPARVTPNEVATAFGEALGHPVDAEILPRDSWEALFRSQGMHNPIPRAQMLDGFNEGWIEFEGQSLKGETSIKAVLAGLIQGSS
jgi:NAD(P)H dehydrogenase (quinone)